ncbi:MAG: signal peptidase I [Christensenellaceae bacterium]|nr:signal peptidase I [Christensenellaceae bacterium]
MFLKILHATLFVWVCAFYLFTLILNLGVIGFKPVFVVSNSMQNAGINKGEYQIVKKIDVEKLIKLDIIAFKRGGDIILHRIVAISGGENGERIFKTKGDNNAAPDNFTARDSDILGKYIDNDFSQFLVWVLSSEAVLYLLLIPSGLFIALECVSIFRTLTEIEKVVKEKNKTKKDEKDESVNPETHKNA